MVNIIYNRKKNNMSCVNCECHEMTEIINGMNRALHDMADRNDELIEQCNDHDIIAERWAQAYLEANSKVEDMMEYINVLESENRRFKDAMESIRNFSEDELGDTEIVAHVYIPA